MPDRLADLPLPTGIRSRYAANVNGLTVHVLEAGYETPGRPCLLLLHGFPELAYSWRKVMPKLAAAGYHVIAPDQRGYGRTTGWSADYDGNLHPFRLMNLVRQNAEIRDIEAVLKQDVALSYKLLRHINSVGFGLMCEIQSFRHAVSILGFNKLHKWLSLLLVTSSRDPSAAALMQTAIARGHFMDLAGKQFFSKADSDNLFITGAFSLLDTLLGSDMPTILEEMHLPAAVSDALLRGEGVYAPFLNLARSVESFDASALARQAEELKIPLGEVNEAMLTALSFADSLDLS